MAINQLGSIEKYVTNAVDTVMVTESKTRLLEVDRKYLDLNFDEAGAVRIMDILLDGLANYHNANTFNTGDGHTNYNGAGHNDGYKVGNVSAKWTRYDLAYDRGRQFQIDSRNNEENAGLLLANLVLEFIRTKVVPEKDETCFSRIAGRTYASLGNKVTETPTATKGASNLLDLFEKGFTWLTNQGVEAENQIIYVSASTDLLLSTNENLSRYITQTDFRSDRGVTFTLRAYKGRPIEVVPDDRFYDNVVVDDNGYHPATGSKLINYMICAKKAVIPVTKIETARVFRPEMVQDFDGYKFNFRLYHDTIVPKNKIVGCYVSLSGTAATTAASKLNLALEPGAVVNGFHVAGVFTNPAGLLGNLVLNAKAAFTVGTKYNVAGDIVAVDTSDKNDNVVDAATTEAYFALLGQDGTAIAVSNGKINLSKKTA